MEFVHKNKGRLSRLPDSRDRNRSFHHRSSSRDRSFRRGSSRDRSFRQRRHSPDHNSLDRNVFVRERYSRERGRYYAPTRRSSDRNLHGQYSCARRRSPVDRNSRNFRLRDQYVREQNLRSRHSPDRGSRHHHRQYSPHRPDHFSRSHDTCYYSNCNHDDDRSLPLRLSLDRNVSVMKNFNYDCHRQCSNNIRDHSACKLSLFEDQYRNDFCRRLAIQRNTFRKIQNDRPMSAFKKEFVRKKSTTVKNNGNLSALKNEHHKYERKNPVKFRRAPLKSPKEQSRKLHHEKEDSSHRSNKTPQKRNISHASGTSGWSCPRCNKRFVNKYYIRQHMKKAVCEKTVQWLKTLPKDRFGGDSTSKAAEPNPKRKAVELDKRKKTSNVK